MQTVISMRTILLVEDSPVLARLIIRRLSNNNAFHVVHVTSYAQAQQLLAGAEHSFFLAILDLVLPDAREGEVVDLVLARGVPVVVFTSMVNDDMREFMQAKGIVDYVVKKAQNVEHLGKLVERLAANQSVQVLVVDDSRTQLAATRRLLELYMFTVFEADNGNNAIKRLSEHPGIRLIITDYMMPGMDGFELLNRVRGDLGRGPSEVAIIGVSAHGSSTLSARFIKEGANDFLSKPYLKEEFICRVLQNVEHLENLQTICNLAQRDCLTGLFNRRHFYELAQPLFSNARRRNLQLCLAVMDIDHFKKVNDTYGHYAGDQVLKAVGQLLLHAFRQTDVVARIGGEEFCVLAANVAPDKLRTTFDRFRASVSGLAVPHGNSEIRITISIGITTRLADDLDGMIQVADELLYLAKENGRNRIEMDADQPVMAAPAVVQPAMAGGLT